jgi:hypothetical protein
MLSVGDSMLQPVVFYRRPMRTFPALASGLGLLRPKATS